MYSICISAHNREGTRNRFNQINVFHFRLVEKALPTIDDFQLQSFLGEGSYGKVYKEQHRQSGKNLAIKTIELHNINERRVFKWVTVEQRILRLVDEEQCPFLVGLLGSFQTPNHVCLAMEYAEGGDLYSYAATGGISLDRVIVRYSVCVWQVGE
ncbi:hypothetical protein XENTR_v10023395 [Xenopus tropicalis]|nr:hypothetical protein XENTR_v10023395 [Xenopus tropicalis]